MIVIPKEEPIITSSNVPIVEAGISVWDVATTYNTTNIIQYGDSVYECLKDGSVGDTPDVTPLVWYFQRKTNYYSSFDAFMNTKTKNQDTIEYTFSASDIDSLAVFNLKTKSVRVIVTNLETNTVIQDITKVTNTRDANDWHSWTYSVTEYDDSAFFKLYMAFNVSIQIIIDNTGSIAECGYIVYGRSQAIGLSLALPAPITNIRNILTKSKDANGYMVTGTSKTYKRITMNVLIDSFSVDAIQKRLEKINGIPCLFVGDERDGGYQSLMTFGLHKDFSMPISVSKTKYQFEIEGVI